MKLRLLAATLVALTLTGGTALAQDTSSSKGQLSYALGFQFGTQLSSSGEGLDINTVIKAVQDGYGKKTPTVPVEQMKSAYQSMMQRMEAKAKAAYEKASVENKSKSDAFLAQNRSKAGVKVLPSGVQYRILETGTGAKPTLASTVDLEVSTPFPLGQHPPQAQPPQKTPSAHQKYFSPRRATRLTMPNDPATIVGPLISAVQRGRGRRGDSHLSHPSAGRSGSTRQ